jgi:hypothetical protein
VVGALSIITSEMDRDDLLVLFAISMALLILNQVHALGALR